MVPHSVNDALEAGKSRGGYERFIRPTYLRPRGGFAPAFDVHSMTIVIYAICRVRSRERVIDLLQAMEDAPFIPEARGVTEEC
jgi:hypothetical protein